MELDKRIREGKKPLNAFDAEEAKQFIGKEGYFTDCLVAFTNIGRNKKCMLTAIDEKHRAVLKMMQAGLSGITFYPLSG